MALIDKGQGNGHIRCVEVSCRITVQHKSRSCVSRAAAFKRPSFPLQNSLSLQNCDLVIMRRPLAIRQLLRLPSQSSIDQLTNAQLRFQSQLGDMARIFQARIEEHERVITEMRAETQAIKQQQLESDQRFEVLLAEIRYLIRQFSPPDSE